MAENIKYKRTINGKTEEFTFNSTKELRDFLETDEAEIAFGETLKRMGVSDGRHLVASCEDEDELEDTVDTHEPEMTEEESEDSPETATEPRKEWSYLDYLKLIREREAGAREAQKRKLADDKARAEAELKAKAKAEAEAKEKQFLDANCRLTQELRDLVIKANTVDYKFKEEVANISITYVNSLTNLIDNYLIADIDVWKKEEEIKQLFALYGKQYIKPSCIVGRRPVTREQLTQIIREVKF